MGSFCIIKILSVAHLPGSVSGNSAKASLSSFLTVRELFLSFPFPPLVLGVSEYSCSLIFPLFGPYTALLPCCLCLTCMYVSVSPEVWTLPVSLLSSLAYADSCRGHFPFSEVGWRRGWVHLVEGALVPYCVWGVWSGSLGPDNQPVWEEVTEKVQTCLYQGLYFRSEFIDI